MEKIASSKISPEDIETRKKQIYIAKKTQRLLGNFITFPAFFKHHLQLIHQGSAFSLHPLYAQYFFKQKLIIQLPIQRIEHAMHDWVQCNAQHLHTSDYFLSNQDLLSISHPVENILAYRHAKELLAADWNYQSTKAYQYFSTAVSKGKPIKKQHVLLDSTTAIDAYFERFQQLYLSIQNHGLLSNAQISQRSTQQPDREIGIAIDRRGNIIKLQGGQHRFALAKLLNISHIPVEIRMVHTDLLQQICQTHKKSPIQAILWMAHQLASAEAVC